MHGLRPTGQYHALRGKLLKGCLIDIVMMNLAIDARFTNPARNQLCVLRPEINNQDFLFVNVLGHEKFSLNKV